MTKNHRESGRRALTSAIEIAGGAAALAKAIGVGHPLLAYWRDHAVKGVPAHYCRPIERATGGQVTRPQLRPDLDWIVSAAS